jgi:hypothetical protein
LLIIVKRRFLRELMDPLNGRERLQPLLESGQIIELGFVMGMIEIRNV